MPTKDSFFPQINRNRNIVQQLKNRQDKQKYHYDKGAKPLQPLSTGDMVLLRPAQKRSFPHGKQFPLESAQVVCNTQRPCSYRVKMKDGKVVERNRRHLKRTTNHHMMDTQDGPMDDQEEVEINKPLRKGQVSEGVTTCDENSILTQNCSKNIQQSENEDIHKTDNYVNRTDRHSINDDSYKYVTRTGRTVKKNSLSGRLC